MLSKKSPQLRFKGFTDDWEDRNLKDILREFSTKSKIENEYRVLSSTNVGMEFRDGRVSGTSNLGYKIIKNGDLVLSPQNLWLGNININNIGTGLVSPSYKTFNFTDIDSSFIKPQLRTPKMLEEYKNSSTQGASVVRRNLEIDSFYQIKIATPSIKEQEKIGSFFKQLDDTIDLHQRKLDLLKEQKKGYLQKMFPKNGAKVPELRFAGFVDDWEERKLGDISYKVKEKNKTGEFTETLTNSAEYGIINQRDFFDKDISNAKNLTGYYVVKNDDFVYNPRISNFAPVGPIKRNKLGRTGVMSPLYYVFRTHDIDKNYFEKYFDTVYWHRFMELNGDSGARADRFAIKDSVFVEMPIPYPTMDEQQKIGSFFKQLDDTIALHQRKLDLLKEQKKGYLQKMFPKNGAKVPELRFAGFAEDWEERKLRDLLNKNSEKNKNLSVINVESVSNKTGFTKQTDQFEDYSVASADLSNYYVIREKQFAYNPSRINVGSIAYKDLGDEISVVSPLYVSFSTKKVLNDGFLWNWFKTASFDAQRQRLSEGGVRDTLSFNQLSEMNTMFPTYPEQEKIGSFFQQLDETIALHQRKLDLLKEQKKGFLQKMFV